MDVSNLGVLLIGLRGVVAHDCTAFSDGNDNSGRLRAIDSEAAT